MTRHQVEILQAKTRIKNKDVVKASGRSEQIVSMVLRGHARSAPVERAFALSTGLSRKDIFPIIPEPLGKAAA